MRVYILRYQSVIEKVWFNLDDAKEYCRDVRQFELVHEMTHGGKYMSEWQDPLTEEIYFLDTHEVIGFPTPETHAVGLADIAAGGANA